MISVEEKLGVFKQYLLKKQREWGKETINAARQETAELEKALAAKIKEDKHSIEERNYHVIFRDRNKIIAQGKNAAKTAELEERNRILSDFGQTILETAKDYVGSDVYKAYLEKCVANIPNILGNRKEIRIFVNDGDMAVVKKAAATTLSDYTIEYDALPAGTIGGIVARDKDNRINCDYTVENLILSNKKIVGMRLNEVMEKQVD